MVIEMSIDRITGEKLKNLEGLFAGWEETMIASCPQGLMGSAWADDEDAPTSAQLVVADFCLFAGEPSEELVRNRPAEHKSDFVIMIPQTLAWGELIEQVYQQTAKRVTRYAIKKELGVFDPDKLEVLTGNIGPEYELKLIDEAIYLQILEHSWSRDMCGHFADYRQYRDRGVGVAVLHHGEVVAGASSYTIYKEGIEVEIDTREDHRRKGLATACGARLILECLKRGLYPSWDAQNTWSVALAEKLGYHYDKEYTAYEITSFGLR